MQSTLQETIVFLASLTWLIVLILHVKIVFLLFTRAQNYYPTSYRRICLIDFLFFGRDLIAATTGDITAVTEYLPIWLVRQTFWLKRLADAPHSYLLVTAHLLFTGGWFAFRLMNGITWTSALLIARIFLCEFPLWQAKLFSSTEETRSCLQYYYSYLVDCVAFLRYRAVGKTQAERMNNMYTPQMVELYDRSRTRMLHGRRFLIPETAATIKALLVNQDAVQWLEIGGGTGTNVLDVFSLLDQDLHARVFVTDVDISPEMCKIASKRFAQQLWGKQVQAVHCVPVEKLETSIQYFDIITMSYVWSMIPRSLHPAIVDRIGGWLDKGRLIIADFTTPVHLGLKHRFVRWWFSNDRIDLTSTVREAFATRLHRIRGIDHQKAIGHGFPLNVPYYMDVWVSNAAGEDVVSRLHKYGVEATSNSQIHLVVDRVSDRVDPALYAKIPDYLYSYTIEDPEVDLKHAPSGPLNVLLLCSGGDNVMYWLWKDITRTVTAVDMNPAQLYLLQWKMACSLGLPSPKARRYLSRGYFESDQEAYEAFTTVSPYLDVDAVTWWLEHFYNIRAGLYQTGSFRWITFLFRLTWIYLGKKLDYVVTWSDLSFSLPYILLKVFTKFLSSPFVMWHCLGVPKRQRDRVFQGRTSAEMMDFLVEQFTNTWRMTTNPFSAVAGQGEFFEPEMSSHGKSTKATPFSIRPNGELVSSDQALKLRIVRARFDEAVQARPDSGYTLIVCSDHLDWMEVEDVMKAARLFWDNLATGGRVTVRSAAFEPDYLEAFKKQGFRCIKNSHLGKDYKDRFPSYSGYSVWEKPRSKKIQQD